MPESTSANGWRKYRFDEMAVMVNDRIDDPSEANVEYYVGLEHLDSESLTIHRWGSPSDVEATKLRFRAGDIIFGRRRVYQRKLAVAHFDGICSAHAMVLRAKPDSVLPEFLPFFMQSDLFMERAKEISVGSLSPTINWKTLAKEEFALPPLEEQRRLVRVLSAIEVPWDRHFRARARLRELEVSMIDAFIATLEARGVSPVRLADLCCDRASYGLNAPATEFSKDLPRYLRITDIDEEGGLAMDDPVSVIVHDPKPYAIKRGNLLFARTGNTVGKAYLADGTEGNVVYAGYLIRFVPNTDRVDPRYLFACTRSSQYRAWIRRKSRVGAQPNINATEYSELPIWLPTEESEQQLLLQKWVDIRAARVALLNRMSNLAALKKKVFAAFGAEEHAVV